MAALYNNPHNRPQAALRCPLVPYHQAIQHRDNLHHKWPLPVKCRVGPCNPVLPLVVVFLLRCSLHKHRVDVFRLLLKSQTGRLTLLWTLA